MTVRPADGADTTKPSEPTNPTATGNGFGAQIRGSRKGLGGDPPNAPVDRGRTNRPHAQPTDAHVSADEKDPSSS
jgi:hypothetical protein